MGKKGGAERPQPAVEATRQRDLQQGAITAEPARLEAGRREVGAAVIADIGERHDTDVDPVAERLDDAAGGRTATISAGLVKPGSGAERPRYGPRHPRQFSAPELPTPCACLRPCRLAHPLTPWSSPTKKG